MLLARYSAAGRDGRGAWLGIESSSAGGGGTGGGGSQASGQGPDVELGGHLRLKGTKGPNVELGGPSRAPKCTPMRA